MKISANQLPNSLGKTLSSCYLISGDEPLLVQEAVDAVRARARSDGFASRELFVAVPKFDWAEFSASAGNLSLFAERRLLELQLPTGKPGRQGGAAIVEMLDRLGDDLVLLVTTPKLDRNTAASKWAKALESSGTHVQVWPIGPRELPGWIVARMRNVGLRADRDAVQMIADRVEGNLLAAQQEIEKLRLLLGEGAVTASDVDMAVADSSRFDVFKLVDAAIAGDAKRAARILSGVRMEGTEPVIVVWALTRELRTLAALADSVQNGMDLGSAMQQARVWSNRQSTVRACIGRHSAAKLFSLLQLTRQADATAKGQSAGDPWQLLVEIVLALALGPARAA